MAKLTLNGIDNPDGKVINSLERGTLIINGPQNHGPGARLGVNRGTVILNSDVAPAASPANPSTLDVYISGHAGDLDSGIILNSDQHFASLSIAVTDGGKQSLDLNSPAASGAFRALRIYNGDPTALSALIKYGIDHPGEGIIDSGLAAHPNSAIGVGYSYAEEAYSSMLIRPTRIGDLNLDGIVSIADFIDLASNFNQPGFWQMGDMNFDGFVTIADFIDLAANFNQNYAGEAFPISPQDQQILSAFAASVPEPATMAFLAPLLVLGRRRRSE